MLFSSGGIIIRKGKSIEEEAEKEIAAEVRDRKKSAIKYRMRAIRDLEKSIKRMKREIKDIENDADWVRDEKTISIGDVCGIHIDLDSHRGK